MHAVSLLSFLAEVLHLFQEILAVAFDENSLKSFPQVVEEFPVACQKPCIQKCHPEKIVPHRIVETTIRRPHAMSDLKARIPERVKNFLGSAIQFLRGSTAMKQKQIYIGKRKKFPATIAAQGHETQSRPSLDCMKRFLQITIHKGSMLKQ